MDSANQQPAPSQPPRPTSITVVSWILIILGIIALISTLSALGNENIRQAMERQAAATGIPFSISFVITFVGLSIGPITGIGMLLRHGWVRFLYVTWYIASLAFSLVTNPQNIGLLIPGTLIFIIVSIFMFRPAAGKYFSRTPENNEQQAG